MDNSVWEQFLILMRQEAGSRIVDTWFKAIVLTRWDPTVKRVYLTVPNKFVRDWVQPKYDQMCITHLKRLFNVENLSIVYLLQGQSADNAASTTSSPSQKGEQFPQVIPAIVSRKKSRIIRNSGTFVGIKSNATFDNFVVGPSNSLAHAAMKAIARTPGTIYNPLFLYGQSGLGKTHLLHAVGNQLAQSYPDLRVLYRTADRFVHEFIRAIRDDTVHKFKDRYNTVDVLLIDDIQFFAKKNQTQEVFFHIFNALYDSHKQLVFSSDNSPQDLSGLTDRLRSRFAWGLVVDLHPPCLETKIAIIKRKADLHGQELNDETAYAIADHEFTSVRELEGALIRVLAVATFSSAELSPELVRNVLADVRERSSTRTSDLQAIVDYVAQEYQCSSDQMRAKVRKKNIVQARHIAMYLLRTVARRSLREIGKFFSGRDHSTVIHAISSVSKHIEKDRSFKARIDSLIDRILGN